MLADRGFDNREKRMQVGIPFDRRRFFDDEVGQRLTCGGQRKVFTTPVRNEADDVSVMEIVPKVRGLNKERGCAAVSIGENVTEAFDIHGQMILQVRAALA